MTVAASWGQRGSFHSKELHPRRTLTESGRRKPGKRRRQERRRQERNPRLMPQLSPPPSKLRQLGRGRGEVQIRLPRPDLGQRIQAKDVGETVPKRH